MRYIVALGILFFLGSISGGVAIVFIVIVLVGSFLDWISKTYG